LAFFNPKEDVIDVQLTSYGKHLLSEGRFEPVYYSFLDDEVVYDSKYIGITEDQNDAQTRIRDNARVQTQAYHTGVETKVRDIIKSIRNNAMTLEEADEIYNKLDNTYVFPSSLGQSSLKSIYYPAWNIKNYSGDDDLTVSYITGSHQILRIPRISSVIKYITSVDFTDPALRNDDDSVRPDVGENKIYEDGSYIHIEDDMLLLEIEEKNVDFLNENFDIEVFKFDSVTDSKISGSWTKLEPLFFAKKYEALGDEFKLDNTYVEYYFDFLVDNEIDKNTMCNTITKRSNSVFADPLTKSCYLPTKKQENIYDIPDDETEECD